MSGERPEPAPRGHALLFLLALLVLVLEPGRIPLFEPDEGRYAEIPREMIASGDWVVPRLNGLLYFEKPPLHYWSVAVAMKLLGGAEWVTRLPVKLASAGLALAAFLFARRRFGGRVGVLAGLITATSLQVVGLARANTIDPSLSLALTAAVFSFVAFAEAEAEGDARRARRALYGLHLSCAAAVMLKGLIGIVLPGGAILLWALLAGRLRLVGRLFSPGPLLVFLLLTVPWHVAVSLREPSFPGFYFVNEHFNRFFRSEHKRGAPAYFFGAVLLSGLLPWTVFAGRLRAAWPGLSRAAFRERAAEAFLWSWSVLVVVFFSLSRSKLIPYVLPVWPALAVLLALGVERARRRGATFNGERQVLAVLFSAVALGGLVLGWGGGFVARFGVPALAAALVVAGAAAGASACLATAMARERRTLRTADPVPALALPWLATLLGAVLALPAVARTVTPWPLVERLLAELGPGDVLVQRGHFLEVPVYYTGRTTPIGDAGSSELDFGREQAGPQSPMFPDDDAFWALWNGPRKVLVIVHRSRIPHFGPPPASETPLHVLAVTRNGKNALLSNRPPPGGEPAPAR
ncbi:phospholipid carrier-dependent glycosyltransferase [Acidobacteria bacterium ACD]|nr:phospholipid carrier-dependent glycosyltransferase [Acidobacteria bacterium ACD]